MHLRVRTWLPYEYQLDYWLRSAVSEETGQHDLINHNLVLINVWFCDLTDGVTQHNTTQRECVPLRSSLVHFIFFILFFVRVFIQCVRIQIVIMSKLWLTRSSHFVFHMVAFIHFDQKHLNKKHLKVLALNMWPMGHEVRTLIAISVRLSPFDHRLVTSLTNTFYMHKEYEKPISSIYFSTSSNTGFNRNSLHSCARYKICLTYSNLDH